MADRRHVLLIGDSNIRKVVQTKELEDLDHLEAAGCSFWNPEVKKWRDRVQDPLMRRLRRAPEVKVLVIHFGTCDDRKDQSEFIHGVESFVCMVRAEFERISFVFSEVLPRQESSIDRYNGKEEARDFNLLQPFLNMELVDLTEKMPRCSLVKHSVHDQLDKKLYWSDSVHLSSWGARLLAKDLDDAIKEALADVARFEAVRPGSSRSRYWEENASLLEQEPRSQLPTRRKLPELPHYEKKSQPRRRYSPTRVSTVAPTPECWDDDDHPNFPPPSMAKPLEDDTEKRQLDAWEIYQRRQQQQREQAERRRNEEEKARLQQKRLKSGSMWTAGCSRGKRQEKAQAVGPVQATKGRAPAGSNDRAQAVKPVNASRDSAPVVKMEVDEFFGAVDNRYVNRPEERTIIIGNRTLTVEQFQEEQRMKALKSVPRQVTNTPGKDAETPQWFKNQFVEPLVEVITEPVELPHGPPDSSPPLSREPSPHSPVHVSPPRSSSSCSSARAVSPVHQSRHKSRSRRRSPHASHSRRRSRTPDRSRARLDARNGNVSRPRSRSSVCQRDASPKVRSPDRHLQPVPRLPPALSPKPQREPRSRRRRQPRTPTPEAPRRSLTPKPQREPRTRHRRQPRASTPEVPSRSLTPKPQRVPRTRRRRHQCSSGSPTRSLSPATKAPRRSLSPKPQREPRIRQRMMPRARGIDSPPSTTTKRHRSIELQESSVKMQRTSSGPSQVRVTFHQTCDMGVSIQGSLPHASVPLWHMTRDSQMLGSKCPVPGCVNISPRNHNEVKHFFTFHMPNHLRHGDDFNRMAHWTVFILRMMQILPTLEDLFDKVRTNGWFPVNRTIEFTGGYVAKPDKRMVDDFAKYIGVAKPYDYSETNLCSVALLINWRVIRCVMLHGMDAKQRGYLRKSPRAQYCPTFPRRR